MKSRPLKYDSLEVDSSRTSEIIKRNINHVWGSYLEWIVNKGLILRVVRVYGFIGKPNSKGARNSLHSHLTSEWIMGISGVTKCYIGNSPETINTVLLRQGDIVEFPSESLHRVEFMSGECFENEVPYAEFLEIMTGDHQDSSYEIVRYQEATKASFPLESRR